MNSQRPSQLLRKQPHNPIRRVFDLSQISIITRNGSATLSEELSLEQVYQKHKLDRKRLKMQYRYQRSFTHDAARLAEKEQAP
eukprot:6056800-Pleurochrysis_carterae.AAC.1